MKELDQNTFGRLEQIASLLHPERTLEKATEVAPGWIYYDKHGNGHSFNHLPPNDFQVFYESI